jgi:hypothetical protein
MEDLQARYPAALNFIAKQLDRRNIFDFQDGVRIMVSRQMIDRRGCVIWLSAGIIRDTRMWRMFEHKELTQALFKLLIEGRYIELSGGGQPMTFRGFSPKGIPYWMRRD